MTFQADTLFVANDFGLRWENGLLVTESGPVEMLNTGSRMELIEVDCYDFKFRRNLLCVTK